MNKSLTIITAGIISTLFAGSALATSTQPTGNPGAQDEQNPLMMKRGMMMQQGGTMTPPKEAIDACSSLANGAACSFTNPTGESVTGTCKAPADKPLACVPANQ